MSKSAVNIIAVDDDELNVEILTKSLTDAGFSCDAFVDSRKALDFMHAHPEKTQVVLLDKMMPGMDGLEVLKELKNDDKLKDVPVILQTGDVSVEKTVEGLDAGAYYYLGKPFAPSVMISLVRSAVRDIVNKHVEVEDYEVLSPALFIREGRFEIKTPEEASIIAGFLAKKSTDSEKISKGLLELILNAIEHGNLNIGYERKMELVSQGGFDEEVERRLKLTENRNKFVEIRFQEKEKNILIVIIDQGTGFRHEDYVDFEPVRLTDPNGRGIAVAKLMGVNFDYTGGGNQVICTFEKIVK